MTPYWVIAIIIFGLYVLHRLALRKAQREKNDAWMMVALFAMILEAEARKARDRQKVKDKHTGT